MTATANLACKLEGLLGAAHVTTAQEDLFRYPVHEILPSAIARPTSAQEVAEIVRFAMAEKLSVLPAGSRSKLNIGRPPYRYDIAIDMSGLRQLVHYDPGDLTLSADAGMTLKALQQELGEKRQFVPLSVPFLGQTTIGGTIASGVDSSLRLLYGSARDFLIGAEFVDGKGAICKSGGRVVKNVTGYDLHKLLIGSLGTLAVITRLNFRTYPLSEAFASHVVVFPSADGALGFRSILENLGLPLSNLEVMNPEFALTFAQVLGTVSASVPAAFDRGGWIVYSSWEGNSSVVNRIRTDMENCERQFQSAQPQPLDGSQDRVLRDLFREAVPLLYTSFPHSVILRIVHHRLSKTALQQFSEIASKENLLNRLLLRPAGVSYLALTAANDLPNGSEVLSRAVSAAIAVLLQNGATYSLLQAPSQMMAQSNLWGPQSADVSLMNRVKHAFDPNNLFAPGRLAGGF